MYTNINIKYYDNFFIFTPQCHCPLCPSINVAYYDCYLTYTIIIFKYHVFHLCPSLLSLIIPHHSLSSLSLITIPCHCRSTLYLTTVLSMSFIPTPHPSSLFLTIGSPLVPHAFTLVPHYNPSAPSLIIIPRDYPSSLFHHVPHQCPSAPSLIILPHHCPSSLSLIPIPHPYPSLLSLIPIPHYSKPPSPAPPHDQ